MKKLLYSECIFLMKWIPPRWMTGAPNSKISRIQPRVLHGGTLSAQTRSMVGASRLCSSDDASMRDPHCKVMLSERTSHTRVESISIFVPNWICRVGMVIEHVWCFVIRWCCGGGVSSILAFRRKALPSLRYFPNETELALGMTLLELHWILQVFCVCQEDGGGVNRGS